MTDASEHGLFYEEPVGLSQKNNGRMLSKRAMMESQAC
jgi:hypothetical protein